MRILLSKNRSIVSSSIFYTISVATWLYLSLALSPVEAKRSSGRRIIDTARQAIQDATSHRQKRDAGAVDLESLLLPGVRGDHLVEYDLILDKDQYDTVSEVGPPYPVSHKLAAKRGKRKAVRHSIYYWPGAEVPYEIHSSVDGVSSVARHRIQKAITHWERHTCIRFVPYNKLKHTNYVSIRKGQWCASKLGMAGGVQPLYVALGCLDTGTIIHELGHTIGWVHEQARPDRDDYVTIKWGLVSASYKSQYIKHGTDFVNTFGVPYDYDSIMHYPSYGELITNDASAQYRIGQRNRLSFHDIQLANIMYKCAERSGCDTSRFECINGGFVDQSCQCVCPKGDSQSCTVTNSILKPYPTVKYTVEPPEPECDTWKTFNNAYIPGNNDDIGFALTVEQCQQRCLTETTFRCASFDYWKQRRQCYLSASTTTTLGIRFSHDSRMVHYELNECTTKTLTTNSAEKPPSTTNHVKHTTKPATRKPIFPGNASTIKPVVGPTIRVSQSCPFEYANTGLHCVRALVFPSRPLHIAETECQQKLGAEIWEVQNDEWKTTELSDMIHEGEEFWIKVKDFQSENVMASFFDFCPYITKENGLVILKDTLCFKQKGFICQLIE